MFFILAFYPDFRLIDYTKELTPVSREPKNLPLFMANTESITYAGVSLEEFSSAVAGLSNASVSISAYVFSSYGNRNLESVLRDIWVLKQTLPSTTSIFVDETSAREANFEYYSTICSAAHLLGLSVILNPGIVPTDPRFYQIADVIVVSENNTTSTTAISQTHAIGVASSKIAALQYGIPANNILSLLSALFNAGAGYAYVTEYGSGQSNPWILPSSLYTQESLIADASPGQLLIPLYSNVSNWSVVQQAGAKATAIVNPNNGTIPGGELILSSQNSISVTGGNGHDVILGGIWDDDLVGDEGNDLLVGGDGWNYLSGGPGDDLLYGGAGFSQALYSGDRTDFSISRQTEKLSIQSLTGEEGRDTLIDIDRIHFNDQSIAFDLQGVSGNAARIIATVFGSSAIQNKNLVGVGINLLDSGNTPSELAQIALNAAGKTSTSEIINQVWQNVFGTATNSQEMQACINYLAQGHSTGDLVVLGSETSQIASQINLVGLLDTGLAFLIA